MSDNLKVYNAVRAVPPAALKEIQAGRLKGKSDINPMWRIKTLTEQFGICGIGWKYEITDKRLESGANEEVAAFVDINLYIKVDGEWSAAIPGTGGSSFVAKEKNGLFVSDECFKMALTDAISVSCKALGIGADVYWDKDKTKYDKSPTDANRPPVPPQQQRPQELINESQTKKLFAVAREINFPAEEVKGLMQDMFGKGSSKELTKTEATELIKYLEDRKVATA
jgi:hypothetical protein